MFSLGPFWSRIFNMPMVLMDRQLALEVGGAVSKVLHID